MIHSLTDYLSADSLWSTSLRSLLSCRSNSITLPASGAQRPTPVITRLEKPMSHSVTAVAAEHRKNKILSDCHSFTKTMSHELSAGETGNSLPTTERHLRRLLKRCFSSLINYEEGSSRALELLFDLLSIQNNLAVCLSGRGEHRHSETLLRHCLEDYSRIVSQNGALLEVNKSLPPSPLSSPLSHLLSLFFLIVS
jgi:hypothetical protein